MIPGTAALFRVGDAPAVKEDSVIEVYGVADGNGKGVILRLGRGGPGMRISLDQALIDRPIKPEELSESMVIFDDIEGTANKKVNKAVQELDKIIQQNASASEEMASSSEELASQAEQLQSAIEFFKVTDDGRRTAKVAARAPVHAPAKASVHTAYHSAPTATTGVMIDLEANGHKPTNGKFERY